MSQLQEFATDCMELLAEKHRSGRISRREMMFGMAALGAAPAFAPRAAYADVPEVVMANWGGDSQKALGQTMVPVYEHRTGGKMSMDASGPSNGKIRAMVEARHVTWDVCDSGVGGIGELGPAGLLTPIDYSVVDRTQVPAAFAYEFGVCNYMSSFIMGWDTKYVSGIPSLADFFDLKKIPGKRAMHKSSTGMMEMALMADGVAPDKLYPLDLDRAFKKIASIKDQVIFWDTGTQSQDLLRSGEVSMSWLWNTRANVLKQETKGRIDWTYRGGFLMPALWVVPHNNPAGKQAMVAIAAMQDPAAQIELLRLLGNGPANPKARAMEPPELLAIDGGAPENEAVQAKTSAAWYQAHFADAEQAFLDLIAS